MADSFPPLTVRVWGDMACFTMPENKVERVSYPVMTPSAARGVLESIFWKPEFDWQIEAIWVLKPIRYIPIKRNEITMRQSPREALAWSQMGGGYDTNGDRTQRHTLALRDVAYVIHAQVRVRSHTAADPAKYRNQFRRRVANGQCYSMPFLGCREFSAAFAEADGSERPINLTDDLGPMLLDLDYAPDRSGRAQPQFFHAQLNAGVLRVPPRALSKEG